MLALILVAYALVGVQIGRRAGWHIYAIERWDDEFDGGAFSLAMMVALCAGALWPFAAGGFGVYKLFSAKGNDITSIIFSAPREVKRENKIKQLKKEAQQRERRIAELEWEAGLD